MDVYIEFTAGYDRFVLLKNRSGDTIESPVKVFDTPKEAAAYAAEKGWNVVDYGHFNLN